MAGRIAWNRKTTTTIISEILEEFPQYDCTHVCYLSSKIPIQIVCPVHGLFKKAKSKGYECQQCSLQRRTDNQTMSLGEFIKLALEVHGEKYDYSFADYKTARIKVKIKCKTHDTIFEQPPHTHLNGKGCKLCANDRQAAHRKADNDHFISRSVAQHGPDLFTYKKLDYKNAKTVVTITCVEHGDFPTYPDNHWLGSGCPDCSESGFSCNRPALFYVMHCEADSITKVGITNTQVDKRNKVLNRSYGKVFKLLKVYKHSNGSLINKLETEMLRELRLVYNQPTHKFKGYSESFYDVNLAELLNKIKTKIKDFNDEIT